MIKFILSRWLYLKLYIIFEPNKFMILVNLTIDLLINLSVSKILICKHFVSHN